MNSYTYKMLKSAAMRLIVAIEDAVSTGRKSPLLEDEWQEFINQQEEQHDCKFSTVLAMCGETQEERAELRFLRMCLVDAEMRLDKFRLMSEDVEGDIPF